MKIRNVSILNYLKMFNIFALILSLFKGNEKATPLYKIAFLSVFGFIAGKLGYIVYRLYKYGYVREIEEEYDDDGDIPVPSIPDNEDADG